MIKVKISKDSKFVAKIVLYDDKKRVLMLKRSENHNKYPGEYDLPGGHVHIGEPILTGLAREVEEETGIRIKKAKFYKKQENKYFFYAKYKKQKINLSKEHTEFAFISKNKLNKSKKFENIAIKIIDKVNKNESKSK